MILMLMMACGGPEVECSEEIACEFGSVCLEGVCKPVPCATSEQCGMEQYCAEQSCQDGCLEDSDCYPGDVCNTDVRECVPGSCRDTQLDCGFGEFCNTASGECYEASGYYCKPCNDDSECGGDGANMCLNWGANDYCGVECGDDTDCPSGYGCLPVGDINGNIISYQCATYCWLYGDEDSESTPIDLPPVLSVDEDPLCDQEGL